jgi:hypothetical protein
MRALFLFLLGVNLVFGAWWYLSSQRAAPASTVGNMQMNAEKVRIIPAPLIVSAPQPASIKKVNACLEWGAFTPDEVSLAQAGIERLALGERSTRREIQIEANFWVHIPPQKNRAEVSKRIAELKKKGVTGYQSILEAGIWHFAISLGAYPTEESARKRLDTLHTLGIDQAVVATREGTATRSAFVVRDPSEQVSAKLLELRTGFPTTEIKTVECPVEAPVERNVTDAPARPAASAPR